MLAGRQRCSVECQEEVGEFVLSATSGAAGEIWADGGWNVEVVILRQRTARRHASSLCRAPIGLRLFGRQIFRARAQIKRCAIRIMLRPVVEDWATTDTRRVCSSSLQYKKMANGAYKDLCL